jgi:hypothetical protein
MSTQNSLWDGDGSHAAPLSPARLPVTQIQQLTPTPPPIRRRRTRPRDAAEGGDACGGRHDNDHSTISRAAARRVHSHRQLVRTRTATGMRAA